MRILIHSNAPWAPTGYGMQTRLLLPQLSRLGHDVSVSAFYGLAGAPIEWNGYLVLPGGRLDYGVDMLIKHATMLDVDVVITLMDFWKLLPIASALADCRWRTLAWLPIDCAPVSHGDQMALRRSGALPVAMTEQGRAQLTAAGFVPRYVPHALDAEDFHPPADRDALRAEFNLGPDQFVIGINAANSDAIRKAWPEQLHAFAQFREQVPDAMLLLHTLTAPGPGYDLTQMISDMGLRDAVRLTDPYGLLCGTIPPADLARWYGALDVLSACSYGEGFGLPIIEAQACGTPVVVTEQAVSPELVEAGWWVPGEPWWNSVHRAWWHRAGADLILNMYEESRYRLQDPGHAACLRTQAADIVTRFEMTYVADRYWKPLLDELADTPF